MNNKKNNKQIIDIYKQPIFVPEKLYVLKGVPKEEYDKRFSYDDDSSAWYDSKKYEALTQDNIIEKDTKEYVILVTLSEDFVEKAKTDKNYAQRVCSHEAFHVAYDIFARCNINLDDSTNEVFAFIVGWATECIYTTLLKAMTVIKTEGKPRDNEYLYMIDSSFGGPLISNQVKLEYNAKTNDWKILIFDNDE